MLLSAYKNTLTLFITNVTCVHTATVNSLRTTEQFCYLLYESAHTQYKHFFL